MPESGVVVAIGRNSFDPPAPVVPVFDVNARSVIYYDNETSGIISYNADPERLQLIASNSGEVGVQTAVFFDAYLDTSLGQVSIGPTLSSPASLPLPVTRAISDDTHFTKSVSDTVIIMWASGTYELTYRITCSQGGTARRNWVAQVQYATPGGSFNFLPGSVCYGYLRDSTNPEQTGMARIILRDVQAGAGIRIRVSDDTAAGSPDSRIFRNNACSVKLIRLE